MKDYGIRLGIEMSQKLLDNGIHALHFYTLNQEHVVLGVLAGLNLLKQVEEEDPGSHEDNTFKGTILSESFDTRVGKK